ncbi:MAG: acyltransferase [Deltaproteobacteria bacterium]|nr:acyltransferase [Deltaproteobacteria bacterium]
MSQRVPDSNRLVAIDFLRGVAVFLVLLRHLPYSLNLAPVGGAGKAVAVEALPAAVTAFTDYGEFGVHLFLVISGFCIHQRWARTDNQAIGVGFVSFWKRRLVRLYPPYFVALLLSIAGLFVLFGVLGQPKGSSFASYLGYGSPSRLAIDLVLLLLLLHNLTGAHHRIGNPPFWSLALEEQLYMLYFGLLWLRRHHGWSIALGVAAVATVAWRAIGLSLGHDRPGFWYIVGPAHWLSWSLGALAVEANLGRVAIPSWVRSWPALATLLTTALLLHPPKTTTFRIPGAEVLDDLAFGATFFVLVTMATHAEREGRLVRSRVVAWLTSLGLISYSVYLTHLPIMVAVKQVALRIDLPVASVLALRLIIPIGLGALFFRFIERPFMNRSRRVR